MRQIYYVHAAHLKDRKANLVLLDRFPDPKKVRVKLTIVPIKRRKQKAHTHDTR